MFLLLTLNKCMLAGKSSGLFCQMLSLTKKCQSRRLSLKLSIYAVESVHLDSQFVCFSFVWMLWQHDYDFVFELIFRQILGTSYVSVEKYCKNANSLLSLWIYLCELFSRNIKGHAVIYFFLRVLRNSCTLAKSFFVFKTFLRWLSLISLRLW